MPEIKPIQLRIPADLVPQFVNMVRVSHTPGEFVLDFSAILPGVTDPKIDTRIVLSPLGAKLLQKALIENLQRFETRFGEIHLPSGHTLAEDLFNQSNNPPPEEGS